MLKVEAPKLKKVDELSAPSRPILTPVKGTVYARSGEFSRPVNLTADSSPTVQALDLRSLIKIFFSTYSQDVYKLNKQTWPCFSGTL